MNEGSITLLPHYANYYYIGNKSGYKKVMSFIRKIKSLSEENASVLMQVDIDYDEIKNICEDIKISDNGYIFLVDENGSIIYSRYDGDIAKNINDIDLTGPDNTDIKFNTENISGSFIVLEHEISDREWKLISLIPKESVKLWYKESRDLFFVISILSLSTCFIIAYFVSMGITKPIEKIVKTMGLVGEGKFITVSGETKNRELQVLVDSFNKMTGEIDSLMKSVIDKEREKSRAEIKALQAQINPHFLYNTLDSIKWMAILKSDHNVIAKSIASLGKLLKHSCKDSDSLIKIGDELSFLDNYIFIQKMRFGEKICVEYSIDNELFEYYTLKFILQPIVENAIIHGISSKEDGGRIRIRGGFNDDKIFFEVQDDGVGMELDHNEKLTGLGINNVNDRIKLNFGNEYGLNINSQLGAGTQVIITLPKIKLQVGDDTGV